MNLVKDSKNELKKDWIRFAPRDFMRAAIGWGTEHKSDFLVLSGINNLYQLRKPFFMS